MYLKSIFYCAVLLGVTMLAGCDADDETACIAVQTITPENSCYDSGAGLSLVASGQRIPADAQYTWSIFPERDSTTIGSIDASKERVLVGGEKIVVPDSLLKGFAKLVVKVRTNGCGAGELHSTYQTFVKRQSSGTNCFIWARQSM